MKSTLVAPVLAAVALLLGAAAPALAVPETELRPAKLERGEDMAIPHLDGKTVVDGDVRVPVRGGSLLLLGKSGDDYVVGVANRQFSGRFRTLRVTPEGDRTVLFRGVRIYELVLAGDGDRIAAHRYHDARTRVRVYDAVDGTLRASRWFSGSVTVLDMEGQTALLGAWSRNRTLWWDIDTDTTEKIVGRIGYEADIAADRLASLTKDPYLGGCSIVTTLTTGKRLWRSCERRVDAFAPGGTRMASIHILSDGIGPGEVRLHRSGGKLLARYTAEWFGLLRWESDDALLLDTNGTQRSATVRCLVADCECASDLRQRPDLRPQAHRAAWRPTRPLGG